MTEVTGPDPEQTDLEANPDPTPDPGHLEETGSPNAEAAKWRHQLRAAEAQRDTLTAALAASQTAMVDTLTAAALVDPADLWRHGTTLAGLLTDDGAVDPDKVTAAVTALTGERPHLTRSRTPRPDPSQGARGPGSDDGEVSWVNAFRH